MLIYHLSSIVKIHDMNNIEDVLEELKQREPIFHYPDKYGSTRESIESMIDDEFWEVGASGQIYEREEVIAILLKRYSDSNYKDHWVASDFKCREVANNNYLLTYNLLQDRDRYTRRATIWRKDGNQWLIMYHQGTVVLANK